MIDTMIRDGLWDAFNGYHMGVTAENVARQWRANHPGAAGRTRGCVAEQGSRRQERSHFNDEIIPVTIKGRKGDTIFAQDEYIRENATLEDAAKLRPAFDPKAGTVTAGNASGINDGAAALVVRMKLSEAEKRGIEPARPDRVLRDRRRRSTPRSWAPGPIPAFHPRAGKGPAGTKDDLDLIEANEAFAAQAPSR